MKWELVFMIAAFGALGALARVFLGSFVQQLWPFEGAYHFPIGTLVVNVLGCFVFGLLGYLGHHAQAVSPFWRTVFLSGLLGSFTTFSTFGYETFLLGNNEPHGRWYWLCVNIGANVGFGVFAIWGGILIGRWLSGPNM